MTTLHNIDSRGRIEPLSGLTRMICGMDHKHSYCVRCSNTIRRSIEYSYEYEYVRVYICILCASGTLACLERLAGLYEADRLPAELDRVLVREVVNEHGARRA